MATEMQSAFSLFSRKPKTQTITAKDIDRDQKKENSRKRSREETNDDIEPNVFANDTEDQDDDGEPATFPSLGISEWLHNICQSLGMKEPTQVQKGTIPAVLSGRDVIGIAHTGSGKTAAFALPILQQLAQEPYGVFALVMTPTRELAFQIADQFRAFSAGTSLKECVVIGGMEMQAQAKELSQRPHIVIATPGRLRSLIQLDPEIARGFSRVRYLVLDEADRLLEPTFEKDLAVILPKLPERRQSLLFSATKTLTLVKLQSVLLKDAYKFEAYEGLQTAKKLKEEYLLVPAKVKEVYLVYLLKSLEDEEEEDELLGNARSVIVFCSTCRQCKLLDALLKQLGIAATALHSQQPQRSRLAALDKFKSGYVSILLATDVASRGLDIPTVDVVINYDLPLLARDYVHRVGRTARAGRGGRALSFVSQHDVDLVHKIEGLTGVKLEGMGGVDEAAVLKNITKVYSAKRAAGMQLTQQEEGGKGYVNRNKKKNNKMEGGGDGVEKKEMGNKKSTKGE